MQMLYDNFHDNNNDSYSCLQFMITMLNNTMMRYFDYGALAVGLEYLFSVPLFNCFLYR